MPATLLGMPRRTKASESHDQQPAQRGATAPVRIEADLAEKINLVGRVFKKDVSDLLSPIVRAFIEREYAKAVKVLADRVSPGQAGDD